MRPGDREWPNIGETRQRPAQQRQGLARRGPVLAQPGGAGDGGPDRARRRGFRQERLGLRLRGPVAPGLARKLRRRLAVTEAVYHIQAAMDQAAQQ